MRDQRSKVKNQNDRAECRKKAMTNGKVQVLEQASRLRWHNIGGQEIGLRIRDSPNSFSPSGELRASGAEFWDLLGVV
jgi:hypothetical protein